MTVVRRPDVTTVEIVGGPDALDLALHPYDDRWTAIYLEHRERIRNPAIDEYLLLRDHLRSDVDDRALYENTKRALISKRWDDMNDYADAKTDVILAIKERARAARQQ